MFNELLRFLLKIVFWIFGIIGSIITAPLFLFLSALFPNFDSYIDSFTHFIDFYFINGLAFAREVFIGVTGYPRPLLQSLVFLFMSRIAFRLLIIPVRFIFNTYKAFKGTVSDGSSS